MHWEEKLKILNSIEILDHYGEGARLYCALAKNTTNNREKLLKLGASPQLIEKYLRRDGEYIDLTVPSLLFAESVWYDPELGWLDYFPEEETE